MNRMAGVSHLIWILALISFFFGAGATLVLAALLIFWLLGPIDIIIRRIRRELEDNS